MFIPGARIKVARGLREQIDKRRLNALFGEILVPTREVTEIKGGKRVKSERKFFPGYIVVQMVMNKRNVFAGKADAAGCYVPGGEE